MVAVGVAGAGNGLRGRPAAAAPGGAWRRRVWLQRLDMCPGGVYPDDLPNPEQLLLPAPPPQQLLLRPAPPVRLLHDPSAGRDEGAGVAGDGSEVVARSRCREGRGTGGGQRIGILEVQVRAVPCLAAGLDQKQQGQDGDGQLHGCAAFL